MPLPDFRELAKKTRKKNRQQASQQVRCYHVGEIYYVLLYFAVEAFGVLEDTMGETSIPDRALLSSACRARHAVVNGQLWAFFVEVVTVASYTIIQYIMFLALEYTIIYAALWRIRILRAFEAG